MKDRAVYSEVSTKPEETNRLAKPILNNILHGRLNGGKGILLLLIGPFPWKLKS